MKITDVLHESTTAGSVATVAAPLFTQSRKGGNLLTGKKTKKKYANSISEGKMKELAMDLTSGKDGLSDEEFKKKYSKSKSEMRKSLEQKPQEKKDVSEGADPREGKHKYKVTYDIYHRNREKPLYTKSLTVYGDSEEDAIKNVRELVGGTNHQVELIKKGVSEAKLDEDDLIIVPGQGRKLKPGFIPRDKDRTDHEVEMARSDLLAAIKNAKSIFSMIEDISEEQGLDGWVQEKIIKASDYLNTVAEYLDNKQYQHEGAGVIAGGPQYEDTMNEKAVSKAQQRFMGMAHAIQKGEKIPGASKELKAAAKGMTKKAAHDYAATKQKGLPEKVDEEKPGLYANIHAKRERIKKGSGERMRKPGEKGAPTSKDWKDAAKTAKSESAIMKGIED